LVGSGGKDATRVIIKQVIVRQLMDERCGIMLFSFLNPRSPYSSTKPIGSVNFAGTARPDCLPGLPLGISFIGYGGGRRTENR
jgi:hypothetical protein